MTVTRGEVGRDNRGKEGRVFRNTIKDTYTKPKGGGSKGGRWEWLGWVGERCGINADNCY